MRDRLVLVFTFTLIFNVAAFGQNWTNPSGGSWGTPSNWSNDGTPTSPVFDLASPAPGYTTSLPTTYNFPSGFAVQTDSVTADLNGNGFSTSALNIASTTGQTGSLTLIGPGTVTLNNSQNNTSGNLDVGDQGGTGQLVVNDATISSQGTGSSHFTADGLAVENRASQPIEHSICHHHRRHLQRWLPLRGRKSHPRSDFPVKRFQASDHCPLPRQARPLTIPLSVPPPVQ